MSSASCRVEKAEIKCGSSGAGAMQRNAAVLTVVCLMTCLTFNYTFPLHRKVPQDSSEIYYPNQTQEFVVPIHHNTIVQRSKKMSGNLENALKRMKDSTQDFGKSIFDHVSSGFPDNVLTEEDLRQYEQMVILKKYPYLDLKELELQYSPSKNTRQSLKHEHGANVDADPGILWESLEEGPNVEITNRGLTGFAIPPELTRHSAVVDNKVKYNNPVNPNGPIDLQKGSKESSVKDMLGSLKTQVKQYVEKVNKLD